MEGLGASHDRNFSSGGRFKPPSKRTLIASVGPPAVLGGSPRIFRHLREIYIATSP